MSLTDSDSSGSASDSVSLIVNHISIAYRPIVLNVECFTSYSGINIRPRVEKSVLLSEK